MHEKYQLISIEELGNATWGRLVFMIYVLHWVSEGSLIQTQKYIGQDLGMKSPWEFPQKPWRLSNKGRSNWKVSNVTSGLTVPSSETHSSPLMHSSQYKKKKKERKKEKLNNTKILTLVVWWHLLGLLLLHSNHIAQWMVRTLPVIRVVSGTKSYNLPWQILSCTKDELIISYLQCGNHHLKHVSDMRITWTRNMERLTQR